MIVTKHKDGNIKVLNVLDYRWIDTFFGIENPLFPDNYIAAIKHYNSSIKFDHVVIEPLPEILELLKKENIVYD